VVVSNIFYFHPENWGRFPIWRAYFSIGLKPPTRFLLQICTYTWNLYVLYFWGFNLPKQTKHQAQQPGSFGFQVYGIVVRPSHIPLFYVMSHDSLPMPGQHYYPVRRAQWGVPSLCRFGFYCAKKRHVRWWFQVDRYICWIFTLKD